MKKVLIISSSPRKGGNSDILCDEFAAGAKEAGSTVEKVRIADKKIGYCTGCYVCQKSEKLKSFVRTASRISRSLSTQRNRA